MAQITIENLTFTYPKAGEPTLKDIHVEIGKGEFVLVCGKSGCGKTTLLRNIKNSIAPIGDKTGKILFEGEEISKMNLREEAQKIGFVFQHPEHQIVTDKVWHELAFGLENLGVKSDEIKLRVAETADYFGFTDKLYSEVEKLSGGQKQLLNIASIMVMQPEVVILDEPTAQLDPIAAESLLSTIYKINRDFGTTIILSEHRLDKVFSMATNVLVMEQGTVMEQGNPKNAAMGLKDTEFFIAMPEAVKIYCQFENDAAQCPLTVGEARRWLAEYGDSDKVRAGLRKEKHFAHRETVLQAEICSKNKTVTEDEKRIRKKKNKTEKGGIHLKDIWFRYDRESRDIVKGLSINVDENEIFGIVGGNGAGKSTMLSIMCGLLKPYRGKVKISGKISMLVQDVQCLFLKDEVGEELESMKNEIMVSQVTELMGLENKLGMHPYDLSGGEQQKLGMAKLLLTEPDIILLDEPTKGMDDVFQQEFGNILLTLKKQGKTIVIVSHDIEFLAKFTDRCGMFFDGSLISVNATDIFFRGNRYYTTEREKILKE